MAERQQGGPWGLRGGASGQAGAAFFRQPGARTDRRLPGKASFVLEAGGEIEVRTPGGGGYGRK